MMILWLAALACLILYRSRIVGFNDAFLERNTTDSIKGIFIFIVLLSHLRDYITLSGSIPDTLYRSFFSLIGQLMVALFLFYFGYGCYESFKKKENYLRGFLKKRVLKTLFNFAAALLLYVLVNAIFHIRFSTKEYLLCWTGWESIGNSNWYIFTIVVLYIMAWAALLLEKKTAAGVSVPVVSILCVAYIYLMHKAGKESWWYDTSLCFPVGMAFSFLKDGIRRIIKKSVGWICCFAAALAAFLVTYRIGGLLFFFSACLFCLVVVLLTAKLRVGNVPLAWMGEHLFEIYILQRLPMIVLSQLSVRDPMLFSALAITATMVMAGVFHRVLVKADALIFHTGQVERSRQ